MRNSAEIWNLVDARKDPFLALADRVWGSPELAYLEYRSAAEHRAMLADNAFRVTDRAAGIETALVGEAGEGGPVIAILGEFDALPGLSQEAGVAEHRPLQPNGNGHGCGHNLLGAASLLAATAVKDYLADKGLAGRVRYYGCPAEEGGAAKAFMVREGLFDDVDIAISWHPSAFTSVLPALSLANTRIDFTFHGRASHAATSPHLGRSALDAIELMNVGANYMREHMPSDARVHYAILDAGGIAPNVVQATAKVRYLVRAIELDTMLGLVERVKRIAEGAALMTETRVEWKVVSGVSNLLSNRPLEEAMQDNLERLGPPPFDASDRKFAADIRGTIGKEEIESAYRRAGLPIADDPLCKDIVPLDAKFTPMLGSTDVGDVSWAVPTVQAFGAAFAIGTPEHSWQLVAQGKEPAAHKGLVHAAKAIAGLAVDAIGNPELIRRAKETHQAQLARKPYSSPLPPETRPPVEMSKAG